jgi:5-methyltetrahydrofolate--homocysteine methyltransferase
MTIFERLANSVIEGDIEKARLHAEEAIAAGMKPVDIINRGLIAGMDIVGPRFKEGEMFIPEVLMCAKAMHAGMDIVKPLLTESEIPRIGKIVLGTVEGDLHDIGKNLVAMMLESSGWDVVNLGVDISPKDFLNAVRGTNPDILAMSALLTTTMPAMKETIDALAAEGLREKVKVIIGGAPVSQDFADNIGADGYAPDAGSATTLCKKVIGLQ